MFRYPKMPGPAGGKLEKCIAFEKYDGTNLHWEWDRARGWFSFGTRGASYLFTSDGFSEFIANHAGLDAAISIFRETFEAPLAAIFESKLEGKHYVVFTEFLGAKSFAGKHSSGDPKRLVLIDVFEVGTGFFDPWAFLERFAPVPIARAVYRGKFTGKFTEEVRAGKYGVAEGVVCKGGTGPNVWMAKVKTNAFLDKLKQAFADDWEQYWE